MNQLEMIGKAEKLAEQFYTRTKSKLGRNTVNRVNVDDLKQEAVVFVMERSGDARMSEPEYFERNVINCLRRHVYRECQIADHETCLVDEDDSDPAPLSNPSDCAAHNEFLNKVLVAVDDLRPKQRAAVVGFMGGQTQESIARDLGISRAAVTYRFQNAIGSLRSCLGVA